MRAAVLERSRELPSYQRLSDYVLTRDPLPRTRLGKIQRAALVECYDHAVHHKAAPRVELSEDDRALLEHPVAKTVWDWLARRYPDRRLSPDASPQLDLGIDSLAWLDLTVEIGERTGVELSEEAIAQIDTVRDLLNEVVRAAEAADGQRKDTLRDEQQRWLEPLGPVQQRMAVALGALNRVLARLLFRLRVVGAEHLPADQFVLVPNHASYLDPFVLAAALPRHQLHRTFWAAWTGAAFANPFNRFISRLGHAVPIEPHRAVLSSLAFCAEVLARGHNLVWFAEGERSRDGQLQPFKPGIGRLLERFDGPVVPAFIHGTHEALPVGARWPRFTRVTVVFGPPLDARRTSVAELQLAVGRAGTKPEQSAAR